MAAFGKKYWRRCIRPSPVTSDEAMGHMPISNWLGVFDAYYVSDDLVVPYQFPQQEIVRTVSQNMAYAKDRLLAQRFSGSK